MDLTTDLRPPARIEIDAPLARALATTDESENGFSRLWLKLLKSLFRLVHQRLDIAAPGRMVLADGRQFAINCANTAFIDVARRIATEGCYEPAVTALMRRLAPLLGTVYDVGANWGYFTLLLGADPAFKGVVHAFEIKPATYRDLTGVVAGAGLSRTVCHPFGLSDHDGSVRLSRERHSFLSRVLNEGERAPADEVAVRRLDGLALAAPDLIKLDVEGHETAVLAGAADILSEAAPFIVLESWHVAGDPQATLEPLLALETQGYVLHRLSVEDGRLSITPLPSAARFAIPQALNLLAIPASALGVGADAASPRARMARALGL